MPHASPSMLTAAPARTSAVERLVRAVRRCLAVGEGRGIVRIEVETEHFDPLGWLAAQTAPVRHYWHGRGTTRWVAGVGSADVVASAPDAPFAALEERVEALHEAPPATRYYGGMRFALATPPSGEWHPFGVARFVLPRVEYVVDGDRSVLAANLVVPRDAARAEAVLNEVRDLAMPSAQRTPSFPLPIARTDVPGRESWRAGIEAALDAFEQTGLDKVVLARRSVYDFDEALDPFALTHALERATDACFHFLIQPQPGVAFVGASPERLFRQDGRTLASEAVAGTRARGASPSADDALRRELLGSDKDRREHGYVQTHIHDALEPLAARLDADAEPSDLPLARGRHLYAGFRAELRAGVSPVDVLRALHPTPAVGGTPTAGALAMIAATEPFDRGWYAGPVGWIGADAAEFAVGIRSGLVRQHGEGASLALYSGAGIVAGSDPGAEWDEIEQKIGNFARVLGLNG